MTHPILPARSYEEALPCLRRPYMPNQVRAMILNAPDNENAPCRIGLYAIGQTAMDRFNVVCGENWSRKSEIVAEIEREVEGKTFYYCRINTIVVAFGVKHEDIGEAEERTPGIAQMHAQAQSWKRAGHWHGPGQCLYAAEKILLYRSGEDDELFIPDYGDDPHKHPYMKQGGHKRVRSEYQQWMTDEGEAIYDAPLDHLAIYREITTRSASPHTGPAQLVLPPTPTVVAQQASSTTPIVIDTKSTSGRQGFPETDGATAPPTSSSSADEDDGTTGEVEHLRMPDEPAASATVKIAESIDYTAELARALSNLARDDGQTGDLTDRQQSMVLNWMVLSSDLKLTSQQVVNAVTFLAANGSCQQTRQVTFSRWLAAKTSGPTANSAQAGKSSATPTGQPDTPTSVSALLTAPQDESNNDVGQPDASVDGDPRMLETDRALVRIHRAMDNHGYSDRTVTQLAALSVGMGSNGRVDWAKVPPQTMGVLADLLESAGSLKWKPDTLRKEVLKAHNSTHHSTAAGRFSAFAGHLMDLAECRSVEAA